MSSDYDQVPCITTADEELESVNAVGSSTHVHAKMIVHDEAVIFQVDSGTSINILPRKHLRDEVMEETKKKLQMWNGSSVKPVGVTSVKLRNMKTQKK